MVETLIFSLSNAVIQGNSDESNTDVAGRTVRQTCKGAAERGVTIESLLAFVSDLVLLPTRPTERDRQRSLCIERLFKKYSTGKLTELDRAELDRLIDVDYQEAGVRADRLINTSSLDKRD